MLFDVAETLKTQFSECSIAHCCSFILFLMCGDGALFVYVYQNGDLVSMDCLVARTDASFGVVDTNFDPHSILWPCF
jgi:hypothetical protein